MKNNNAIRGLALATVIAAACTAAPARAEEPWIKYQQPAPAPAAALKPWEEAQQAHIAGQKDMLDRLRDEALMRAIGQIRNPTIETLYYARFFLRGAFLHAGVQCKAGDDILTDVGFKLTSLWELRNFENDFSDITLEWGAEGARDFDNTMEREGKATACLRIREKMQGLQWFDYSRPTAKSGETK